MNEYEDNRIDQDSSVHAESQQELHYESQRVSKNY